MEVKLLVSRPVKIQIQNKHLVSLLFLRRSRAIQENPQYLMYKEVVLLIRNLSCLQNVLRFSKILSYHC